MSQISSLFTNGNPLIAGAISLWLLGVTSILLRKMPAKLYAVLKARFIVSATISGLGEAGVSLVESVILWYMGSPSAKNIRDFCIEINASTRIANRTRNTRVDVSDKDECITLGPGFGTHMFVFKGRVGWLTRKSIGEAVSTSSAAELSISFIGNNPSIIHEFLETIKQRDQADRIAISEIAGVGRNIEWRKQKTRKKRNINSVILNASTKKKLLSDIDYFYANQTWYEERSLNYKLTYLLHGEPGTGKSSLIFALASHYGQRVFIINLAALTGADLSNIVSMVAPGAFIVIEDIDASEAIIERQSEVDGEPRTVLSRMSLSVVLNVLDGIASLENNVVFITTNHIDKLDKALTRRGRIDHIVEILPLTDIEIREYTTLMYPDEKLDPTVTYADITGCDLQAIFLEHKEDYSGFVNALDWTLNREG